MVKYLLVEDERFAYEELKRMMQRLRPSWQLAGWAESVEQAVLLLRQGSLDLMIVDIRLSDGLSFEIFEQCPVDLPVIFTTAYDEYAIKAFKVNSIDYLLKPIEESDLEAALCKFERNSALRSAAPEYRQLELGYLAANKKNRFLVQVGDFISYGNCKFICLSSFMYNRFHKELRFFFSLLKRKKEAKKEKSSRFTCTVRFQYHPKITQRIFY